MSHLIDTMAYTGQTPWHQLGHALPKKQSIDTWAQAAGMQWQILETPVRYLASDASSSSGGSIASSALSPSLYGEPMEFPDQKVLYRSDTKAPLSVVSNRYQVVQPRDVLEFYRDLTEVAGYELETAGVLKAGRKFWALARTGKSSALKGDDLVNGYLLLATSCDGTLATVAMPTTVRVVCNNTLAIALQGASNAVRVPHSTSFDAQAVKRQLGIAVGQWDAFIYQMRTLAERKVKSHEAMNFFPKCCVMPTRPVFLERAREASRTNAPCKRPRCSTTGMGAARPSKLPKAPLGASCARSPSMWTTSAGPEARTTGSIAPGSVKAQR